MATPAQINYITSLAESKDLTHATKELLAWLHPGNAKVLESASNAQVSQLLTELKGLPRKTTQATAGTNTTSAGQLRQELTKLENDTMKGRYFIVDPMDDTEKFIKVDKPEPPSRWSGYTFINVQASDDFYPVKKLDHKVAILKAIAVDPITAMNEYGQRLGVCGCCGRTLTARDSRLRGLGPICASRILGQPTDEQLNTLQQLGLI